jgi:hypothetical protein
MSDSLHMQAKQTPLTKKGRNTKVIEDDLSSIDSIDSIESLPEVKKTVVAKEKKARSQAQIDAFKRTQENRAKNIALKKETQKLEAAKLLLNEKPVVKETKQKSKKPVVEESSDEEEVIIVEKRKKNKQKPKRIIVEESSSEEEEEQKEMQFKSQQNKKSLIQMTKTKTIVNPNTMFFV